MRLILLATLFALPTLLTAQPTWSESVAPIIYRECASCHVDGGIAPFSLTSFDDAYWMSASIKHAVETKEMPPFPADVQYRRYAHERVLTDADIATIVSWVEGGSPQGDPSKAPEPPTPRTGPTIKNADLVVTMPEYTSTAATSDVYRCFSMRVNNSSDHVLEHVEVVPGNPEIVHHVLVFVDTSPISEQLDAQDPEPGYVGFGGVGSNTAELISAYVPGIEPVRYPAGFGLPLPAGSRVIFQVHYPAGTAGKKDQTTFRATFSKASAPRIVSIAPVLHQGTMLDGPLVIPANTVKTFHQQYTVPIDVSVLSVIPHMHLIGKSTKVWAVPPSGDTIPLVRIPQWDFHWQMVYTFQTLQKLSRNTRIQSEVVYDNTANNPENPSSPPKLVRLGESTTDEMILTYIAYVPYQFGDEAIRLDAPVSSVAEVEQGASLSVYPNPTSSTVTVHHRSIPGMMTSIRVVDATGNVVAERTAMGTTEDRLTPLDVRGLAQGSYQVVVSTGNAVQTSALSIVR